MWPRRGSARVDAPQEIVIELFGRRRLERVDLAALRIDAAHDVLDGAVLAGGVHRLEDQQHRPAVLRVEPLLELGHPLAALLQHLVGDRLEPLAPRVRRVDVLQAEPRAVRDAVAPGQVGRRGNDHDRRSYSDFLSSVLTANASDPIMIRMPMACVQRPIA